jgi:hypothetical protein
MELSMGYLERKMKRLQGQACNIAISSFHDRGEEVS